MLRYNFTKNMYRYIYHIVEINVSTTWELVCNDLSLKSYVICLCLQDNKRHSSLIYQELAMG